MGIWLVPSMEAQGKFARLPSNLTGTGEEQLLQSGWSVVWMPTDLTSSYFSAIGLLFGLGRLTPSSLPPLLSLFLPSPPPPPQSFFWKRPWSSVAHESCKQREKFLPFLGLSKTVSPLPSKGGQSNQALRLWPWIKPFSENPNDTELSRMKYLIMR